MKKNLLWSLFAATALMTACSEEAIIEAPKVETKAATEMTTISLGVNVGDISTYATSSGEGGWTNFVNKNLASNISARVIIQIFDTDGVAPITDDRMVITQAQIATKISGGNTVTFDNIRIPLNGKYTAVTWVDFIAADNSTIESANSLNDLWYTTSNLSTISMVNPTTKTIAVGDVSPETRDAYVGRQSFSISNNGTVTGATGYTSGMFSITAKRPFAKVRFIMTDWNNKADWNTYFANVQKNIVTTLNMGVAIGGEMSTGYNALKNETTGATPGAYTFTRNWGAYAASTFSASVNNVNWVYVDAAGVVDGSTNTKAKVAGIKEGYYPVLDFQYLIPHSTGTYSMEFKLMDQAKKDIYTRTISSVPVKTNCLTTIFGNFLTMGYGFKIIVNDAFDNYYQVDATDNSWIIGDGTTNRAEITVVHKVDAPATIDRIDVKYITKDNFDEVIAYINKLTNKTAATVRLFVKSLPDYANNATITDFNNLTVGKVQIILVDNQTTLARIQNLKANLLFSNEVLNDNETKFASTFGFLNGLHIIPVKDKQINIDTYKFNYVYVKSDDAVTATVLNMNGGTFINSVQSNVDTKILAAVKYEGDVTTYAVPHTAVGIFGATRRTLTAYAFDGLSLFMVLPTDASGNYNKPFKAQTLIYDGNNALYSTINGSGANYIHKIDNKTSQTGLNYSEWFQLLQ